MFDGDGFPTFIPGNTLDEVASAAESWEIEFEIVSGLYCAWEPG
ncbi:MAG TPA: hypothetical protein PKE62_10395 [Anaerolineales bacterium]|nr:hypothetical protein [Anaerolineales bacterium]